MNIEKYTDHDFKKIVSHGRLNCVRMKRRAKISRRTAIAAGLGALLGIVSPLNTAARSEATSEAISGATPARALAASFRRPAIAAEPARSDQTVLAKIALGKSLFFDKRLSGSGALSCASCHDPSRGWQDGRPTGIGDHGARLQRRTPGLFDVAFVEPLCWDGRTSTLEEQARTPLASEIEMNLSPARAAARLSGIEGYAKAFQRAFPGQPISLQNIAGAIAAYERTIVSKPTPFDRWVEGDEAAIPEAAKRGFEIFAGKGQCANCHSSWRFTDDGFRDIGLASRDEGRGAIVPGVTILKYAFKTPSLLGVAERGPYMHDGSLPTLEAVVDHYDHGFIRRPSLAPQIQPLHLTARDREDLIAFMRTLSSSANKVTLPVLPR